MKFFIEKYINYTKSLMDLAIKRDVELKFVEIELHPGFVNESGDGRLLKPIVLGMADYIEAVYEAYHDLGIQVNAAIENRGSSILKERKQLLTCMSL